MDSLVCSQCRVAITNLMRLSASLHTLKHRLGIGVVDCEEVHVPALISRLGNRCHKLIAPIKISNAYVHLYIRAHMSPPAPYHHLHSLQAANVEFCYGSDGVDGGLPQPPHRPVLQVAN